MAGICRDQPKRPPAMASLVPWPLLASAVFEAACSCHHQAMNSTGGLGSQRLPLGDATELSTLIPYHTPLDQRNLFQENLWDFRVSATRPACGILPCPGLQPTCPGLGLPWQARCPGRTRQSEKHTGRKDDLGWNPRTLGPSPHHRCGFPGRLLVLPETQFVICRMFVSPCRGSNEVANTWCRHTAHA